MVQASMRDIQGASRIGRIVTGDDFFHNRFESSKFNKNPIFISPQNPHFVWYIRHIVNVDCLVDPISALLFFITFEAPEALWGIQNDLKKSTFCTHVDVNNHSVFTTFWSILVFPCPQKYQLKKSIFFCNMTSPQNVEKLRKRPPKVIPG